MYHSLKLWVVSSALLVCSAAGAQKQEESFLPEGLEGAGSYSISVIYYDGQCQPFPIGRADVEKMFPQLRGLPFKKSGGAVTVELEIGKPMLLADIRFDPYFKDEILHNFALEPPPQPAPNSYQYFQPIVLSVNRDSLTSYFTVGTIGRLFNRGTLLYTRAANSNDDILPIGAFPLQGPSKNFYRDPSRAYFPERSTERRNVLDNLRFIQMHLQELLDARYALR